MPRTDISSRICLFFLFAMGFFGSCRGCSPEGSSPASRDAPELATVMTRGTDTADERLKSEDLVEGKGPLAEVGKTIKIHYVGTLANGKQFDSSEGRGPLEFKLGHSVVIKGLDDGIVGMRVGGKRHLVVPPAFGYGSLGHPNGVPPGATLDFMITLVGVE